MTPRRPTLICTAALVLASVSSVALAQTVTPAPPTEERVAFERGFAALQSRRFAEAELALREAMRLRPTPVTQYNLGLALRGLGRYLDAVEVFEAYLRAPEAGASPERLAAVREELADIRRAIARVELAVRPPTAALRVDGRPVEAHASVVQLDPGVHVLDVEADGFERDHREVTLVPGAQVVLVIALRPVVAEARLVVEPSVPNARVSLDARPVGGGRVDERVAPGEHVVEVRATGYETWRRTVRVNERVTLRVDAALTPVGGASRAWVVPVAVGGGVLVAAGVVTAIVLATRGDEEPIRGNWGHFVSP